MTSGASLTKIDETQKNYVKTIKTFLFFKNTIFRVQTTMPGKKNFFLCAKNDLLCAKAIFL
jgi:hypothetical protein